MNRHPSHVRPLSAARVRDDEVFVHAIALGLICVAVDQPSAQAYRLPYVRPTPTIVD